MWSCTHILTTLVPPVNLLGVYQVYLIITVNATASTYPTARWSHDNENRISKVLTLKLEGLQFSLNNNSLLYHLFKLKYNHDSFLPQCAPRGISLHFVKPLSCISGKKTT